MSSTRTTVRTAGVAVRAMLVLTLVLGVGYTLVVTGIGQLLLPWQANGSPLADDKGSALIDQPATDADGDALPEYFQSRPSAAGDGYDGAASSGSNLGPENADLISAIEERKVAIAEREGVDPSAVPPDAVTASASGLDPDISEAYADLQVPRVAAATGLSEAEVRGLVADHTSGRTWGVLGEPRVNVLELNIAVQQLAGS
jgi:potassium-transporting ATPase KdpC subunit